MAPSFHLRERRLIRVLVSGFILILASGSVSASDDPDQIQVVFRISQSFLAEVTDQEINADIPFCDSILKFRCTGVIHGTGQLDVELQESGSEAVFEVVSEGNAHACVRGVRGPIVVYGPAWGPFSSRTLIGFDGREFRHLTTSPSVRVCANINRITTRHDRPAGRMLGKAAMPVGEKLLPRAIAEGTPVAKRHLKRFVVKTANQIIEQLNERTPIEETLVRLFPETSDWVFQMSADQDFMQAALGPENVTVPVLPDVKPNFDDVALEVWLRSTNDEAKLLADMTQRPLAQLLIQRYLESTLPELADLADERSVQSAEEWVVIRIGMPEPEEIDSSLDRNPILNP